MISIMQLYVHQMGYIISMRLFSKNKIPTLIEKPLTITTDEATKLINLKKKES